MNISQIELVSNILKFLDKRKVPVNARQMNTIIAAVDTIMEELHNKHTDAKAGCGLRAWLDSDSTGLSSHYMARVLAPLVGSTITVPAESRSFFSDIHYPHDPADFWRCQKLLEAVPEMRPHLAALASGHGPEWAGLIAAWSELETLYREEFPSGKAPKLFKRMQEILRATETATATKEQ